MSEQSSAVERATMQDVADRAGVSRTTASFVLNGRDDMRISAAAQARVMRAARELDYRPNLMARSLKTRVTKTLALLSDGVATDGYAGQLISGSVAAAMDAGHVLYVGEFGGDRRLENRIVDDFVDRHVDGFVYASTRTVTIPDRLRRESTVLVNCHASGEPIPSVVADDVAGGRDAAEALLEAGHRSDVFLIGETPPAVVGAQERLEGIQTALAAAGVALAGTVECKWWPESAYEAVGAFLAGGARPKALICLNDRVALGVYQALHRIGFVVPDDVSIVSFDDSPLAAWMQPALTSVAIPHYELGRAAVELLLTSGRPAEIVRLPMPIRHRDSVGPPRG